VLSETTFATFLLAPRYDCGGTTPKMRDRHLRLFGHIARADSRMDHTRVLFDPSFLDCHAVGNDLPGDHNELGFVRLNRTCGRSTSAWCQLGNGLRIVNGGSRQLKWLCCIMGHALDDDDDGSVLAGHINNNNNVSILLCAQTLTIEQANILHSEHKLAL